MKGFEDILKSKVRKINTQKIRKELTTEQLTEKAYEFQSKGNFSEALNYFRRAIKIGAKDPFLYVNYGSVLKKQGELLEAEAAYRRSIELKPDFAITYAKLANLLWDLNKLKEAELAYRKSIELKPDFAVYNDLGALLIDLGKYQEARLSLKKAIKMQPSFAKPYCNLGNFFLISGKYQKASEAYLKAIKLQPEFSIAHKNLGSLFRDQGELKKAELHTRKAIELQPNFADAYCTLGSIYFDLSKHQEALDAYQEVIKINPKYPRIYNQITLLLENTNYYKIDFTKLENLFSTLIERKDINQRKLSNIFNFLFEKKINKYIEEFNSPNFKIECLSEDNNLMNTLKTILMKDIKFEKLFTQIRKNLCAQVVKDKIISEKSELEFLIALGQQCFLNEYIYEFTEEEQSMTNKIIDRCQCGDINESKISMLSCYFPLYKLIDKLPALTTFISLNKNFQDLIKLQIKEPLQEQELSKKIKKLGSISDEISLKVKGQYEQNPYPRWKNGDHFRERKMSITQLINSEIIPNSISSNKTQEKLEVLVAGCGTGHQILQTQRYHNAEITCIDLSLASLSYSQRKINEFGINNVQLLQMDILELGLLEKKFDVIECGGVLHHMKDPLEGLEALTKVLKNKGFLKLGLYSELGRKEIVSARKYIKENKLQTNEDSIRNFRKEVFFGGLTFLKSLKLSEDFYSLSQCRDLCFHEKEHRFNIKQLAEILNSNQLKFLGFLIRKQTKDLYKTYFPDDQDQVDLNNWLRLEEMHPTIFQAMYQFWVQKK